MKHKEKNKWKRVIKAPILFFFFVSFFCGGNIGYSHSPHDNIDSMALSPAFDLDQTLFISTTTHLLRSQDGGQSWKELTNGLDNKNEFSSIAISPCFSKDNTLLASTAGNGVYHSHDGGNSWKKHSEGLANLNISKLGISCRFGDVDYIVLAAGGEGGMYRADSFNSSWREVMSPDITINAMSFSTGTEDPPRAFAGTSNGIVYQSKNGGMDWEAIPNVDTGNSITAMDVAPPNTNKEETIFLGTDNGRIFKSVDNMKTFQDTTGHLVDLLEPSSDGPPSIISIGFSPAYHSDSMVFVSTWYQAAFVSQNSGVTWQHAGTGLTTDSQADDEEAYRSPHFRDIQVSNGFEHDHTLFLGGFDGLFKSTDAGKNWIQLEVLPVGLIKGMDVGLGNDGKPRVALATYGGGVYFLDGGKLTWTVGNEGLTHTRVSDIVFSPNFRNDGIIFSGSYNLILQSKELNGTWKGTILREDGWMKKVINLLNKAGIGYVLQKMHLGSMYSWLPRTWQVHPYPTQIVFSPSFSQDKTLFFGTRWHGIYKSSDGGKSAHILWDALGQRVRYVEPSPNYGSDRTLFASVRGKGIYKTTDDGKTWVEATRGIAVNSEEDLFLAISTGYAQDKTLFCGGEAGLFLSTDGGTRWEKLVNHPMLSEGRIIGFGLAPNFSESQTFIVSVKGKGLLRSQDRGKSFVELAPQLIKENHSIELIKFSPTFGSDNIIYMASDEKLFFSSDRGMTWTNIPRFVRYEDYRNVLRYKGRWKKEKRDAVSANTVTYSETVGDEVILDFVGSGITWLGTQSDRQGAAAVYVDGAYQGDAEQYSPNSATMVKTFSLHDLPYGPHSIRIKVGGQLQASSGKTRVEVDAFDIHP